MTKEQYENTWKRIIGYFEKAGIVITDEEKPITEKKGRLRWHNEFI